ncbi:MAG TPA: hypothetical protein VNL13_05935 [Sulfolobales archaeon]|nr:hypothetical protein [Sulfolobales archaeon]
MRWLLFKGRSATRSFKSEASIDMKLYSVKLVATRDPSCSRNPYRYEKIPRYKGINNINRNKWE